MEEVSDKGINPCREMFATSLIKYNIKTSGQHIAPIVIVSYLFTESPQHVWYQVGTLSRLLKLHQLIDVKFNVKKLARLKF